MGQDTCPYPGTFDQRRTETYPIRGRNQEYLGQHDLLADFLWKPLHNDGLARHDPILLSTCSNDREHRTLLEQFLQNTIITEEDHFVKLATPFPENVVNYRLTRWVVAVWLCQNLHGNDR